ncbi:telomerase reverse transcriptase [Chanos chanos]|uniref:Telomerase reverse transcriptase n=1 Tax=Chanos chanos TaxID=29144 RepID=A0A6J2WPR5_CHACN|nr:telomerase reverse transcriptase [Chanos chanos]
MSECNLTRVLELLRSLYPRVQTLEEYSNDIVFSNGENAVLVEESDTSRFKSLVKGLIVCPEKPLREIPHSDQLSTLPEVLAYVLNYMQRRKKRNVLKFGYLSSDKQGDCDPFKLHGCITQSAAFISGSELWKKINQRLGTDITKYLLQHCALFVAVPPSCLFQVCGVPVYDLVPARTWSGFFLSRSSLRTSSVATREVFRAKKQRKMTNSNRKPVQKTKKRRRDDRGEEEDDQGLPFKKKRIEVTEKAQNGRCPSSTLEETESVKTERGKSSAVVASASKGRFSWKTGEQPPSCPSQCFIRVLGMLYGGKGMKNFILNRKIKAGVQGLRHLQGPDLVRVVFFQGEAYLNGEEPRPKKLPKRFFNMVGLFSRLLRRHKTCPYAHFLRKKCTGGEGKEDMVSLLSSHCSSYRVYLFLRECIYHVVPEELWGTEQNRLLFLSHVKHFLRLGKFERLSLVQVMWRMKVSECSWLRFKKKGHCPSEQRYREWILGQFLAWLLDTYVLGLVRAMFYVTESMSQKHALRFYRREVWVKLQKLAFSEHLSKGQWETLTPSEVAALPKTTVTSRIRFIPKANGMRPITKHVGTSSSIQFRSSVRDLCNVLALCLKERPSLAGSTVWGHHDIHRILKSIVPQQKKSPGPLYFVKVDVSGAYDSLPHDKLLEVVGEVLQPVRDVEFSVRHYAKIWGDSLHGLRRQFCTKAETLESPNMKGFVLDEQRNGKLHNGILVEMVSKDVKGRDIFNFFKQMLTSYVIQFEKNTFRQVRGIPQGSAVSTMLCNLCYGHMESALLSHVTEKGGCLMRLVDDFLLITPKLNKAMSFLKTLLAGVPQYGCVINPQKVAVNFPLEQELSVPGITQLPLRALFPWCGLLLDTHTLDVYNDYSSYAGLSLRYSLTLGSATSPATFMRKKLMSILRLKCNPIFLDVGINSLEAVYKNIYKIVLLQAQRFHACARSLPLGQNVGTNPLFFLRLIWSMVKLTNKSIRQSNPGKSLCFLLQYEAVELLYCLAFEVVFTRYRPSYSSLLPPMCKRKLRLQRMLRGMRLARVRQAATPKIPPDFKAIKA